MEDGQELKDIIFRRMAPREETGARYVLAALLNFERMYDWD